MLTEAGKDKTLIKVTMEGKGYSIGHNKTDETCDVISKRD